MYAHIIYIYIYITILASATAHTRSHTQTQTQQGHTCATNAHTHTHEPAHLHGVQSNRRAYRLVDFPNVAKVPHIDVAVGIEEVEAFAVMSRLQVAVLQLLPLGACDLVLAYSPLNLAAHGASASQNTMP